MDIYIELKGTNKYEAPDEILETMRSIQAELQSYRTDNERLMKDKDEKNERNTILLKKVPKQDFARKN